MSEKVFDTLIVGGGIAGLASAAFLSNSNCEVLLIEKNKECGGLVNTFSRDGFYFDAGVRALLDAGIIFPMLKELDLELEVVKSPVSVGIGNDIMNVHGIESLLDYKNLLVNSYPDSEKDIENLLKVIRKIMKHMDVLYGVENPVIKNFFADKKSIFTKLLPWLPKFLFTIRKINRMGMPVEQYLESILKDPSVRDIVSQHFFKSTPSFFALSYFSLYLDYFYPVGGVGSLAKVLEDKILDQGGEIQYETFITKVDAYSKQISDEEGNKYSYKNLVWAADLKSFYRNTQIEGLSKRIINRFKKEKKKMLSERGGDSVFTIFLEVDAPIDYFRDISNGHFFYTPSKQGLGELHRAELETILEHWEETSKAQLLDWIHQYIRLNTYEISIPGLKDSSLVPEGKTGLTVSFLSEYDLYRKMQDSGIYNEMIVEIEKSIIDVLSASIYPVLKEKLISHFSFSPLNIESRVGTSEGAITGWSFQNTIPVVHKMQQSGRSIFTSIPSIYRAGQWTYSPAGVPMSILTGKLAADKILRTKW